MLGLAKKTDYLQTKNGFALPTVLIASIVMIIVLLSSVSATVAVRTSMADQYYNQLAKNASEAGVAYALACLSLGDDGKNWGELNPNVNCDGLIIDQSNDNSNFLDIQSNYKTTFSVKCGDYSCGEVGTTDNLISTGYVRLLRDNEGISEVWREYSVKTRFTESGLEF